MVSTVKKIYLIGFEGGFPKPMRGAPDAGPMEASRSVLVVERFHDLDQDQ